MSKLGELMIAGAKEGVEIARGQKDQSRVMGYTGDTCRECGNFTMVRNGVCLRCNTCGATTGCS